VLSRRDGKESHNSDRIDTIVGRETEVKGIITSSGTLRVDGRVEGEIHHRGDLIIGESGVIVAKLVQARNISVAGRVESPLSAENKLELVPSARVSGDIKAVTLIIAEGAVFKGGCEMTEPEKVQGRPPAPRGRAES
jgi:cytoskeletal protein CcmA (bactofilin family)